MKAAVYTSYGPPNVLQLTEVDKPQPKENEILIKIHAATVTAGDVRLRASDFPPLFWLPARLIFGLFKPKKKILGHELSGTIEAIGKNVTKFKVGDKVFGTTTMLPTGSYAEYICLPEEWKHGVLSIKPDNLGFKEAAALPIGAMTAMYLLDKASLNKGQKVLVYGASGSVGSYAVQLAKQQDAMVTAVCSGPNFDMVRSLGADDVLDYKKEDYSESHEKFDIVFDAVGKTAKSKAKKVLKEGGAFVTIKMLTKEKIENLGRIKQLAEAGKLKPFLDRTFGLNEIVAAHEYVDLGRKRGNVVIEIVQ
ncbi:NAD(P)-dependent alcohol dehydrogenase [Maribacter sp. TH_r10]|uniref:NAD(P)-dependent alcohol dehydrogenase n=1 Tax=Maribacter sp. TH_r10 TaxID=3082086 RepID=UPI002955580D|nr:NAD(P)-dependent alcohol dehydrogenase [Maribacter sp. TH_r10]MDV7140425.1 NAD(P)-dependent alcohol dehydrogenase [Maribacter sp. TH_r10]